LIYTLLGPFAIVALLAGVIDPTILRFLPTFLNEFPPTLVALFPPALVNILLFPPTFINVD